MSWFSDWGWRASFPINGSTAGVQSNYIVRVNVTHLTDMLDDFGDVRFTAADGSTEYVYQLESYVSGISAIFFVNITSIPADPDSITAYMYYNKPGVTTTSVITHFLMADLFDDQSIDTGIWTTVVVDAGCTVEEDASGYLHFAERGGPNQDVSVQTDDDFGPQDVVIRFRVNWGALLANAGAWDRHAGFQFSAGANKAWVELSDDYAGAFDEEWEFVSVITAEKQVNFQSEYVGPDEWHVIEIRIYSSDPKIECYVDDVLDYTETDSTYIPSGASQLRVRFWGNNTSTREWDDYYDWVHVRGCIDPEPVVGSFSAPESEEETDTRAGWLQAELDSEIRAGYIKANNQSSRGGYILAERQPSTQAAFTSISERLLDIGNIRKAAYGTLLTSSRADTVALEFDNADRELYDEINQLGIFYPKIFKGTVTNVYGDVIEDSNADFSDVTITGLINMVTGDAIGKRYFVIYNSDNSVTVLPDYDDTESIDPETDGVVIGDQYIIDASFELWALLRVGFQFLPGTDNRVLWFGGHARQLNVQNNPGAQSVIVRALGFDKLLEDYHAYNVCESDGRFYFLPGITPLSYTHPSSGVTQYGPRRIAFKWREGRIEGLEIDSVQQGSNPGLKIIEFRPPHYFRYQTGSWAARSSVQTEYLYDELGNTITCKFGGRYPAECQEMFFIVADKYRPYVLKEGMPSLQIGEGEWLKLKRTFIGIFRNYLGSHWIEYTDNPTLGKLLARNSDWFATFFSYEDEVIYLCSTEPFSGIEIELTDQSDFNGDILFRYSQGTDAYGCFDNMVDATSNFANSGRITWDIPNDWVEVLMKFGTTLVKNVYILRIDSLRKVSGTVLVKKLGRSYRVFDEGGLGLDIECFHDQLPHDDVEDTIIIKNDGTVNTWYNMIDLHTLAQHAADEFGFPAAARDFDALKFSWDSPRICIWGALPFLDGESRAPGSIAWDSSNEILYVGYENELWAIPQNGESYKVVEIRPYANANDDSNAREVHIKRLAIHTSGRYIEIVAWKPYNDEFFEFDDINQDDDNSATYKTTPAIFAQWDTVNEELTWNLSWDQLNAEHSDFLSGEVVYRKGAVASGPSGTPDNRQAVMGQFSPYNDNIHKAGENIAIPIPGHTTVGPQTMRAIDTIIRKGLMTTDSAISNDEGNVWAYQEIRTPNYTGLSTYGPFYTMQPGWYCMRGTIYTNAKSYYIWLRYTLGQRGMIEWNAQTEAWRMRRWNGDKTTPLYLLAENSPSGTPSGYDNIDSQGPSYHNIAGVFDTSFGDYTHFYYIRIHFIDTLENFTTSSIMHTIKGTPSDDGTYGAFTFAGQQAVYGATIGGVEKYCTPLEISYNSNEGVFHGCLLNRNDLTYHYYVFDPKTPGQTGVGVLYSRRIGDNNTYQIKSFAYNSSDGKTYSALCDVRYHLVPAQILKATFDSSRNRGEEIEYEFIGIPDDEEYDVITMSEGAGRISGITGPNKGMIFQITSEFYPRAMQADLSDMDGRELFEHICQVFLKRMRVTENNKLTIKELNL